MAFSGVVEPQRKATRKSPDGLSSSGCDDSESCSDWDHATALCPELRPSSPVTITGTLLELAPLLTHMAFAFEDGEPARVMLEDRSVPRHAGSALHEQGRCRPCAFVNSEAGCHKGDLCQHCHLEHTVAKWRVRPCKGKRMRIRKSCERIKQKVDEYIAAGRPTVEITDYLLSLELPSVIEGSENAKKSMFTQMLTHVEETYGVRLVESF